MGKDGDPGGQQHPPLHATSRPTSPAAGAPSQENTAPRDPKMQAARVRLPDGQFKEFELHRGSEGEVLFRLVTQDLSIEEREYFSLCFYDKSEGGRHWLYNDKKILRQLKGLSWEFSFEVKFYPTTPSTLVDDHARYYLFLQLRRDILTGRLPATSATHALLGSYVAQIEFGDAPPQMTEDYEKYLVGARAMPDSETSQPDVLAQVVELHREHRGQTASEAENAYLDACKQLAMYGIHIFPAKDKENGDVNIGIGAVGINVYKEQMRVHRFGWQNIIKISYRRNTFQVKLKAGEIQKNETTVVYKLPDYLRAKRIWKCAVEHHTFFRLIQPDDKPKPSLLHFGSQRFRYQGRTQFQTKMASQMFDRPSTVERSHSALSHPVDSVRQVLTPLHYTDTELEHQERDKKKSKKGKKETDSSVTSDSEHDEKRDFAVVAFQQESGQPHTTVSSWQETSELPEQVEVYTDENGKQITRTIKSSQVKHTVQTQSFQNYIVDGDHIPVGVVQVERSREQLTPLGQQGTSNINNSGIAETQTRTMTYEAQADNAPEFEGMGEYVSSKSVTQGNRTIETITYKTEKDGIIETHVEHRVTIHSDGDIDHDAELSQAILEATNMNPDMVVEKIEVRQETTN